jgi:hypothetical protein
MSLPLPIKDAGSESKLEFISAVDARKAARDGLFLAVDSMIQNATKGGLTYVELNVTEVDTDHLGAVKEALSAAGYKTLENSRVRGAENYKILTVKF